MGFLTSVSILFWIAAKPSFFQKRHPKGQVQECISQILNSVENLRIYICVGNNNAGSIIPEEHMKNTEVQEQLIKIIIKQKRMYINK